VQTFIKGTQYCSYSVARDGELVAHACYPTRFSAGIGATLHFQPVEHPGIQQFVQAVAKELRFTGQLSFDFIVREDHSFFPIECNPRTTSGVHLFKGQGAFPHVFLQTPAALITPLPTIERQLALPMFLYSFRKKGFWPAFRKAKDVIWDRRDPWPAFDQWLIYSVFIWRTWWTGKSILALTTSDIEWAGEK
jgi:hypothetical protein